MMPWLGAIVLLTLVLCSPTFAGWAIVQEDGTAQIKDAPASLEHEITAMQQKKLAIKAISMTPRGGWLLLTGKNGFVARNISGKAFDRMAQLAKQNVDIKSVALGPGEQWVILFDKNGFAAGDVPEELRSKLDELSKANATLKCVALGPGGAWVILHDRSHFAAHGISDEEDKQLRDFEKQDADITAVAFTPGGGWAITGHDLLYCINIPDSAFTELEQLGKDKAIVKCVAFSAESFGLLSHDPAARQRVLARMEHYKVPGMSIAIVDHNEIVAAEGYGLVEAGGAEVNRETRFQAGSVSKPVASLGILRLVEQGKLSLDADLNDSLVSWKIKSNQFTQKHPVTLREVMSHTAGFNVHGFGGYQMGQRLPTVAEILNGAEPANSPAVVVETVPGTKFAYSGGGITVMQLAAIDVTHRPFDKLMQELVLDPLEMKHSTYEQPLPRDWRSQSAVAHNGGKPIDGKWHVYPEKAAAGLWTTPSDLGRYIIGLARAGRGESGAILSPEMAKQMLTRQTGGWGLGISVEGAGPNWHFSHNGVNDGFLTQMIGYVEKGQGVVVMVNSDGDGASALLNEICEDAGIELGWN